jgi:hypothetical protein
MQFLDPKPTKPYSWRRTGNQAGIPEGQRKCRDCGQIKPETFDHWKRHGLRWQQPCKACRP